MRQQNTKAQEKQKQKISDYTHPLSPHPQAQQDPRMVHHLKTDALFGHMLKSY